MKRPFVFWKERATVHRKNWIQMKEKRNKKKEENITQNGPVHLKEHILESQYNALCDAKPYCAVWRDLVMG
jgi:hypothetical protein